MAYFPRLRRKGTRMAPESSSSTLITRVSLTTDLFVSALDSYLDENKPDRLIRDQMKAWTLEWFEETTTTNDIGSVIDKLSSKPAFSPSYFIDGYLILRTEYVELKLLSVCYWRGDKEGSLHFKCQASARLLELRASPRTSPTASGDKKFAKIYHQMMKRLKADDYLEKILRGRQDLLEASITVGAQGQLEERVSSDEETAESIRRAVFSATDSLLDVFDFILSLPFLPTSSAMMKHNQAKKKSLAFSSPALAERARLRLLEDVMYDACEQEEEDDLVNNLHINSSVNKKQK